ncbi:hypothetical protein [Sedimenticola selenatireducens]|uniref:Pentapeptide repeat-containing protein n=1 Tax=Sedimenticola selenatireducens TaxID=191960 RepID=A0A558DKM8_9GAMM|nr:hypothetical protein [Sedimenticola selenatireducens]TVO71266.1 hypothetical protein FHP88_14695 [Sedimenticola selenatireducens]TVT61568.1 MAG: hypothetical protein FHK78_17485 [Sedimenticola selenatireducens]
MTIESINSEMISEFDGNFSLVDRIFDKENFKSFIVNPKEGTSITIENCSFVGCKVIDGDFSIMKGTVLKNVTFIDFNCGNAMHISAEAVLDNVKIAGSSMPKMIWIRPQDGIPSIRNKQNNFLDISEYDGEVSITGFPVDRVKINRNHQVVVKANLLETVDWKGLGLSTLSYWKMMAKKASIESREAGIFSMPPKSGRNYERSMKELNILRNNGYI